MAAPRPLAKMIEPIKRFNSTPTGVGHRLRLSSGPNKNASPMSKSMSAVTATAKRSGVESGWWVGCVVIVINLLEAQAVQVDCVPHHKRPNGLPITRAALIDREDCRAKSSIQNRRDLGAAQRRQVEALIGRRSDPRADRSSGRRDDHACKRW